MAETCIDDQQPQQKCLFLNRRKVKSALLKPTHKGTSVVAFNSLSWNSPRSLPAAHQQRRPWRYISASKTPLLDKIDSCHNEEIVYIHEASIPPLKDHREAVVRRTTSDLADNPLYSLPINKGDLSSGKDYQMDFRYIYVPPYRRNVITSSFRTSSSFSDDRSIQTHPHVLLSIAQTQLASNIFHRPNTAPAVDHRQFNRCVREWDENPLEDPELNGTSSRRVYEHFLSITSLPGRRSSSKVFETKCRSKIVVPVKPESTKASMEARQLACEILSELGVTVPGYGQPIHLDYKGTRAATINQIEATDNSKSLENTESSTRNVEVQTETPSITGGLLKHPLKVNQLENFHEFTQKYNVTVCPHHNQCSLVPRFPQRDTSKFLSNPDHQKIWNWLLKGVSLSSDAYLLNLCSNS